MEDNYHKLEVDGDFQSLKSTHNHTQANDTDSQVQILGGSQRDKMGSRTTLIIVAVVTAVLGITLGVLIGWFSSQAQFPDSEAYKIWLKALEGEDEAIREMILEELNADVIKENLRTLTAKPHLAGTPADKENAEYVKDKWDEHGLDSARIVPYNVLLSYPLKEKPNFVYILNPNGTEFYKSDPEEKDLDDGDKHPDTVPPFNAYAAEGTVEGDLVYVNYGRIEDFQKLDEELKVNVTGKICIARYGKIFRGDKAKHAQQYGAVGLVIYSDPADYAADDNTADVYPHTWWLPGSGVQRGSLYIKQGLGGDPLTPAYPSSENAYRYPESSVDLPKIPVQPIGYENAKHFLEQLDGDRAPDEWQGNIDGLANYNLGPGLLDERTVKLEVNNIRERKWTYNVIGMIRGSQEPDRYVILGNHRDAWVFGAVDPSSGTAVMLEITRAMGKLVKSGKWRPRRSIVFCSWAAEEYSLIGSTEWVEEFSKNLGSRAVAYLNVDNIPGNYTFRAKATPNLLQTIFEATKYVRDAPFPGHSETVYDTWLKRNPDGNQPKVSNLGSGSDYASFLGQLGISAVDLRYTFDSDLNISSYPLYHSMYETFHLVSEIMDRSFEYHLAVARVWAEMSRNLADSLILPFDCRDYTANLEKSIAALKEDYEQKMNEHDITFDAIDSAFGNLTSEAVAFHERIANSPLNDPFYVRRINDQLMYVDRAFTDPLGLPDRQLQRHVAFAPSSRDAYFGEAFPGIADLMFEIDKSPDPAAQWERVREHMSVIAFTIQSVATTIKDAESIDTLAPQR
ncbi:N-acetylated-alpha-linked acidic dipeptidase 2-like isoform X2 [Amphiura filiformis]|uniref:N-acetylated-alpha-linked acidic dipeptidase 2-like isoform X2 n=1 Tax=Amphiura filiformis TaxID=82378 RepID=UPI003B2251A7